jgi:inosine-uridine nucleoside N-ribohydrolase
MQYLARKIQMGRWEIKPYIPAEEIRADAITGGCLRTIDDNLSLWQCKNSREDVEEIALALASGMQQIEGIKIVLLNKELLENSNFSIESSTGRTPVVDLCDRHIDVTKLTMIKICKIAEHVKFALLIASQFYQFTKAQIKVILCKAITNGRIKLDMLGKNQQKLKDEIEKALAVTPK